MHPLDPLTLRLRGQILIEASAGTGKTYTIALLFLRLLLEQGLSVDEILVVTFTEAAAEELRGRIRQRIRDALDVLEGQGPDDPLLHELLQEVDRPAAILLSDALTRMDEAAIYTIHSFCHRMLQEHAFESGAPFEMELVESEAVLRKRIIEDFWRQRFYTASYEESAWAASLWTSPADLLNKLGGHLSRADIACVPFVDAEEIPRQEATLKLLFAEVQQQWQPHRESIAELLRNNKRLRRSKSEKRQYDSERLEAALALLDRLVAGAELPYLAEKELELLALFTRSNLLASLKAATKNNGEPPEHPFFDLFEQLFQIQSSLMTSRQIGVLLEARTYLRSELARRKQEQSQLSFDDLLTALAGALQGPEGDVLARSISRRFPVIMVDEFQDTDQVQYRIFKGIHAANMVAATRTSSRSAGLFLIGDPKQAIYSFRGADIFTYIQARHDTPEQNRLTMTTNYRSSTAMVKAVSHLFAHEAPFLFAKDEIDFPQVEAATKADTSPLLFDNKLGPALTCLLLPESEKPLAKMAAEPLAARCCAHELAALLAAGLAGEAKIGAHNLAAGDLAVLVRTNDQAELIRQELNALGIASVCGDKDSVFAAKEAQQLLRLLTSLSDLADLALMRTALAGDLFGWTAEQIDQLREDEQAREKIMADMSRYHQLWQQQGFLPMLQQLLSEQKTVGRLHAAPSGERMLTNILHLAELLQEASRQRPGVDALLRWFSDQMQQPESQAENQQLRLESDENLVKIVTIHKAKGMEYPLVFLPFLWTARPCSNEQPLAFHRYDQLCLDLGSGSEEHFRLAERERLAEDLRLLYVAVTRAIYACFFCWGRISKMEESALYYLLQREAGADLERLWDVLTIKPCPTEFVPPELRPADDKAASLSAVKFRGKIVTDWQIVSYSSLTAAHKNSSPEQPDHDELQAEETQTALGQNVFGFPKGAAAGTCLHAILEQISFSDASGHEAIIRVQLERAGFAESWLPVVSNWMQDLLHTPLLDKSGSFSLSSLNERERVNEMAFYFPLATVRLEQFNRVLRDFGHAPLPEQSGVLHGLMTGFIDLIFCWQGRYYLADYKSNHLGSLPADYSPDKLAAAMSEHRYDLQYLIYTVVLHRFLAGRIRGYCYEQHFGGVFYLFLRGMKPEHEVGCGVFTACPPLALVESLDRCFGGITKADGETCLGGVAA
ncbi:exodeoxyribonuclease V subunit beta [Desulfobulbus sp. F5]|nr:exodeoxyribonuclease V subunit beta [Desulfobulbus sp. F5]